MIVYVNSSGVSLSSVAVIRARNKYTRYDTRSLFVIVITIYVRETVAAVAEEFVVVCSSMCRVIDYYILMDWRSFKESNVLFARFAS